MRSITRDEYMQILHDLRWWAVCPHLTPEEAVEAFISGGGRDGYVALLPTLVRGAYQVARYSGPWVSPVDGAQNAHLAWSYVKRTAESYTQGVPRGSLLAPPPRLVRALQWLRLWPSLPPSPVQYVERAIAYAEEHWSDTLIVDDWTGCVKFYLEDPTDLTEKEYPTTKATVVCGLNRLMDELWDDQSRPLSVLIDEAIVIMSTNQFEAHEIRGDHSMSKEWNCAYCGYGLGKTRCWHCGHEFEDWHLHTWWRTPLPPKVVALLQEEGFTFGMNPEIARRKEFEEWGREGAR